MNKVRQPDRRTKFCYILIQDFLPNLMKLAIAKALHGHLAGIEAEYWAAGADWGRLINVDVCSALCRNYMQIEYDIQHFLSNTE